MIGWEDEFLRTLQEIDGGITIPSRAEGDLVAFFPDRYRKNSFDKSISSPANLEQARVDYLEIVKRYLRFYKIPITIESVTGAYFWGIKNIRNKGIESAPDGIKYTMARIRHALENTAMELDKDAE